MIGLWKMSREMAPAQQRAWLFLELSTVAHVIGWGSLTHLAPVRPTTALTHMDRDGISSFLSSHRGPLLPISPEISAQRSMSRTDSIVAISLSRENCSSNDDAMCNEKEHRGGVKHVWRRRRRKWYWEWGWAVCQCATRARACRNWSHTGIFRSRPCPEYFCSGPGCSIRKYRLDTLSSDWFAAWLYT